MFSLDNLNLIIFKIKYYFFIFLRISRSIFLIKNNRKFIKTFDNLYNEYYSNDFLIVGNGPDLKIKDLEKLNQFKTIASNKVHLLYNKTKWRPDIFTITDPLLIYKNKKINNKYKLTITSERSIKYFETSKNTIAFKLNRFHKHFEPHPYKLGFFIPAGTITVFNIQLAIWLNAKRIFLIGVNHDYMESITNKSKIIFNKDFNHYDENYRFIGEPVYSANIKKIESAYKKCLIICKKKNIKIINISRNTKLNIFPKDTPENYF